MPNNNERVNIYNGNKRAFLNLINNNEVDPNGVYFIDGDEHEIYVGTQLYGNGSSGSSNITHVAVHCYGPILQNTEYEQVLTNISSSTPMRIFCGGVYLNGLRTIDEIQVGISIESDEDNETYHPKLTVSSEYSYSDNYTELTIDLYVSQSDINKVNDTVVVEVGLLPQES